VLALVAVLNQCPNGKYYHGSSDGNMNPPSGKEQFEKNTTPNDTIHIYDGGQRDAEHPYE